MTAFRKRFIHGFCATRESKHAGGASAKQLYGIFNAGWKVVASELAERNYHLILSFFNVIERYPSLTMTAAIQGDLTWNLNAMGQNIDSNMPLYIPSV